MDFGLIIKYVIILLAVAAACVVAYVAYKVKSGRKISDAELKKIHIAWKRVNSHSKKDADRVFSEGDKLVDHVLGVYGYKGTMADKMKKAKPIIRGYQDMWWVHKKRNALAHDITAEVNPRDADRALRILKRVLKGLKAI